LSEAFAAELKAAGAGEVYPISGVTGEGLEALLDAVISYLPATTVTERPDGKREEADDKPWSPI
jgi:GTPase